MAAPRAGAGRGRGRGVAEAKLLFDDALAHAEARGDGGDGEAAETSVAGLSPGDVGKLHRRPVGKPRDERQAAAHGFDRPTQRREQQIAALLHPGHGVLAHAELAGDAHLSELAGLAQLAQRHLLGDEFRGHLLDLAALGGIEPGDHIFVCKPTNSDHQSTGNLSGSVRQVADCLVGR